jgi:PII-like signaling protein
LRVHLSENDRYQGRPLHEAIVARCREMKIAGATVLRGLEGYGESAELHRRTDRPILIMIVDTAEKIDTLIPAIEPMINTGVLAVSDVRTVRVQRDVTT